MPNNECQPNPCRDNNNNCRPEPQPVAVPEPEPSWQPIFPSAPSTPAPFSRLQVGGAFNNVDAHNIDHALIGGFENWVDMNGTRGDDQQWLVGNYPSLRLDAGFGNDETFLTGQNGQYWLNGNQGYDVLWFDGLPTDYMFEQNGDTTYFLNRMSLNQGAYTGYEETRFTGHLTGPIPLWSNPWFQRSIPDWQAPQEMIPTPPRPMIPSSNGFQNFTWRLS
jgi:hypothetical protein